MRAEAGAGEGVCRGSTGVRVPGVHRALRTQKAGRRPGHRTAQGPGGQARGSDSKAEGKLSFISLLLRQVAM